MWASRPEKQNRPAPADCHLRGTTETPVQLSQASAPAQPPVVRLGAVASGIIPAMANLTRADVEHVAHLARLGLTEDELARLEGQLNHILDQYAILTTLDTEHIPPTAQTIELANILREDVVQPSLTADEALANAPERIGGHFAVPAILGGEGGA
jgi:aspartyl-tRNA(Asn)/glutamyl-tRNA(Gln) amidotransferase subunit C